MASQKRFETETIHIVGKPVTILKNPEETGGIEIVNIMKPVQSLQNALNRRKSSVVTK